VVLVNAADLTELPAITVRAERSVQPHNFWVGRSDEQAPQEGVRADG
jgi:hypothetical protein